MRFWRRDELPHERNRRLERRRKWRRRLIKAVVIVGALLIVGPTLFIATQCTGSGSQTTNTIVPTPFPIPEREESLTFLTLPEWSIVYSTEEYARVLARAAPSEFPYFRSSLQYWSYVNAVCEVTTRHYPFNTGYQVMLGVIGASFTAELVLKGVYENTVGRLFEWIQSHDTAEDQFAARTAKEYGAFMHTVPWYEFPFGARLGTLWKETPLWGRHPLRKWERRVALTAEYGGKAIYGWIIRKATQSAYAPEDLELQAWVASAPEAIFQDKRVQLVKPVAPGSFVVRLPRYEPFTDVVRGLARHNVEFVNIAGNDEILLTVLAKNELAARLPAGELIASIPILSEPPSRRLAVRVPVKNLVQLFPWFAERGATIEHVYDY
jgi:hypothetical protein